MRAEWLTFDCYGTLIDWESGIRNFFRGLAGAGDSRALLSEWEEIQFRMIRGPYRPYREILADSLRKTLAARSLVYRPELGAEFAEALTRWTPFPDTNPTLEKLRDRKFKLGIISNIDDDLLKRTGRHFTVPFDLLVTAEQSGAYKPDAASFRLALARMGCRPSSVAHVAFGERYDLATARGCGMQVVFVNRYGRQAAFHADAEISTLAELPGLLES